MSEKALLLGTKRTKFRNATGLSVTFAMICIIDVFGVFPIVALPKAFIDCGFYGIPLLVTVSSIQMYTAILLGNCWLLAEEMDPNIHSKSRCPYSALAEITYGLGFSKFVTCLLDVTIFAGGIPNLIVASENLQLLGQRLTENKFDVSYCYWMIFVGAILCPFLWLGSPKDMKLLCSVSVCLVASVFVLLCGCVIFDSSPVQYVPPHENSAPLWNKLLTAYGVLVFQYDIHPTVLTIQVDMAEKEKLPKAIIGGFAFSLCMFILTSVCASAKYEGTLQLSILEAVPSSIFLHMCALLVALQLGLTLTISNSALYQHMENCLGISREFNHKRCIIRTLLIVLAVLLAESVPRFDLVMAMIGGTLTAPIVFIFPPLFYVKMLSRKTEFDLRNCRESIENVLMNENERICEPLNSENEEEEFRKRNLGQRIVCIFISCVGFCSMISMTYVNVLNTIHYARFSEPCIYNITNYF